MLKFKVFTLLKKSHKRQWFWIFFFQLKALLWFKCLRAKYSNSNELQSKGQNSVELECVHIESWARHLQRNTAAQEASSNQMRRLNYVPATDWMSDWLVELPKVQENSGWDFFHLVFILSKKGQDFLCHTGSRTQHTSVFSSLGDGEAVQAVNMQTQMMLQSWMLIICPGNYISYLSLN